MFSVYIAFLIFGGVFVSLSVLSGMGDSDFDKDFDKELAFDQDFDADGDVDLDVDGDVDLDVDGELELEAGVASGDFGHGEVGHIHVEYDVDGDGGSEIAVDKDVQLVRRKKRYNPFLSFRFYTFTSAFFGLTGTVLSLLLPGAAAGVFAAAAGMGLTAGLSLTYLLHLASISEGGRTVTQRDYIGMEGRVTVPIPLEGLGKVRFRMKGQVMELPARAEGEAFGAGAQCLVIGVEDGVARVVLMNQFESGLEGPS